MKIYGNVPLFSTTCLTGPAILVCQRRNPSFFCPRHPKKCHRPHVIPNNIYFYLIQLKKFARILIRFLRMCDTMKPIARLRRMGMPIIQEQVMEHPASCCRLSIQFQEAAPLIVIVCHVHTMLIAIRAPVMGIKLHPKHNRMPRNILYFLIKFILPRLTLPF